MTEISPPLPNQENKIVVQKRSIGSVSKYHDETWAQAQDLVENHPEQSLSQIAKAVGMPVTTLESKAQRAGWLNKRDLSKVRKADESLKKITREIAFQINDLHAHVIAMIEAIQYSYRIKIVRDDDGKMHYINFDDFPDRPVNWNDLGEKDKEAYRRFIPPKRLAAFQDQLHMILQRQQATIDFTAKITKAALPKVDPDIIDFISRPAETNDMIDGTGIFEAKAKEDTENTLDKLMDELKGSKDE